LNKEHLIYYGSLFLGWVLYAYFTFQSPILKTAQGLGISVIEASVLVLALIIPYGLIWFIALFGALRLRSYAQSIFKTPDGAAFARIDIGLFILVLALVLPSLLGSILAVDTSTPGLTTTLTLISNYSSTILPFIAFGIIFIGTMGLTKLIKRAPLSRAQMSLFLIPLVVFAPLYFWLTFSIPNVTTTYDLPDILILCTILVC
jgi:hypothetical protein